MRLRSPELVEGRIACHGEADRQSRADCRSTGILPVSRTGILPVCGRAVPAPLPTAKTTGEIRRWRMGLMGGTPMPRCRTAASMDCGGKSCEALRSLSEGGAKQDDDTALARPVAYKSKAASRPPHFTWRLTLILAAALLPSVAFAQSHPAESRATKPSAPTTQPAAVTPPITFARSGQEVEVEVLPPFVFLPESEKAVVLRAFGRIWTRPANVTQTSAWSRATITIPQVRVTTVFSVVNHSKEVVGEVVAYPDRHVAWDAVVTLYSCATPEWFNQWSAAIGLPVKKIEPAGLYTATLTPEKRDGNSLLILGHATAGQELSDLLKRVRANPPAILVLEAAWFGEPAGAVSVKPAQMRAGLAEIVRQRWPKPLEFAAHRTPWPSIANRWAWIVDDAGLPLVEEIWASRCGWREVCSYLPWAQLLGRREEADELLLHLMSDVAGRKASAAQAALLDHRPLTEVSMIWPPRKELSPVDRPVLYATDFVVFSSHKHPGLSILDLRGSEKFPADILPKCQGIEKGLNPSGVGQPQLRADDPEPWYKLLILGDDKVLDDWKWLKLDRAKKRIGRDGVQWLPADELPPSKDDRIKLMLKLTELGVPLVPPSQQEEKKQ